MRTGRRLLMATMGGWEKSIERVSSREAIFRKQQKAQKPVNSRAESVIYLKVKAQVRSALDEVWLKWRHNLSPLLKQVHFKDLSLSPDFRQIFIYWQHFDDDVMPRKNKLATVFMEKKPLPDESSISKALSRISTPLRFEITRRLHLKYSPALVFHKWKFSKWAPPLPALIDQFELPRQPIKNETTEKMTPTKKYRDRHLQKERDSVALSSSKMISSRRRYKK